MSMHMAPRAAAWVAWAVWTCNTPQRVFGLRERASSPLSFCPAAAFAEQTPQISRTAWDGGLFSTQLGGLRVTRVAHVAGQSVTASPGLHCVRHTHESRLARKHEWLPGGPRYLCATIFGLDRIAIFRGSQPPIARARGLFLGLQGSSQSF